MKTLNLQRQLDTKRKKEAKKEIRRSSASVPTSLVPISRGASLRLLGTAPYRKDIKLLGAAQVADDTISSDDEPETQNRILP